MVAHKSEESLNSYIASKLDNIHITLDILFEVGDLTAVSHIIQTIGPIWETHGYLSKGRYYLSSLLAERFAAKLPRESYARICQITGDLARHQSDYKDAKLHYQNGLKRAPARRQEVQSAILLGLGETAFRQGKYQRSKEHYQEYHQISFDNDKQTGIADALNALGRISMAKGDLAEARERLEQSQHICHDQDYLFGMGWVYNAWGELARAQHQYDQAIAHYKQSIQFFSQVENVGTQKLAQQNLAFALLSTGNNVGAEKLFTDLLRFWHKGQAKHGVMLCLIGWSALFFQQRRYEEAAQLLLYATDQLEQAGIMLELDDRFQHERMLSIMQNTLSSMHLEDIAMQVKGMSDAQIMSMVIPSVGSIQKADIQLTPREEAVLQLIAQGFPDKKIAEHCVISRHTVNTHLRNIYRKLKVNTRTEATHMAHQLDII